MWTEVWSLSNNYWKSAGRTQELRPAHFSKNKREFYIKLRFYPSDKVPHWFLLVDVMFLVIMSDIVIGCHRYVSYIKYNLIPTNQNIKYAILIGDISVSNCFLLPAISHQGIRLLITTTGENSAQSQRASPIITNFSLVCSNQWETGVILFKFIN